MNIAEQIAEALRGLPQAPLGAPPEPAASADLIRKLVDEPRGPALTSAAVVDRARAAGRARGAAAWAGIDSCRRELDAALEAAEGVRGIQRDADRSIAQLQKSAPPLAEDNCGSL